MDLRKKQKNSQCQALPERQHVTNRNFPHIRYEDEEAKNKAIKCLAIYQPESLDHL